MKNMRPSRAFTLIELLTVVLIIAILVAMLLPALSRAKYQARHVSCVSNQKQAVTALIIYTEDYDQYYPAPSRSAWTYSWYPSPFFSNTWDIGNSSSFNAFSSYIGGPYGNWKDLTVRNDVMACPQGLTEVPWDTGDSPPPGTTHSGSRTSYSLWFYRKPNNIANADSGNLDAGSWRTGASQQAFRRNMVRRITDNLKQGSWAFSGSSPLTSDVVIKRPEGPKRVGSPTWNYLSTNHVFSGDKGYAFPDKMHFSSKPLYWGTSYGFAEANYGFNDGSVRQFKGITQSTMGATMYQWNTGGVGVDTSHIPKEWTEY